MSSWVGVRYRTPVRMCSNRLCPSPLPPWARLTVCMPQFGARVRSSLGRARHIRVKLCWSICFTALFTFHSSENLCTQKRNCAAFSSVTSFFHFLPFLHPKINNQNKGCQHICNRGEICISIFEAGKNLCFWKYIQKNPQLQYDLQSTIIVRIKLKLFW